MKIKGYLYIGITVLIIGLIAATYIQSVNLKKLKDSLYISKSNEKALFEKNSLLEDNERVLQLTVEQLNYVNDSIIVKMNELRKELKIKDKDIVALQYQLKHLNKKDTVIFRDTLFKSPDIMVDTLLRNEWYSLGISLRFPSSIEVEPTFKSEQFIFVNTVKETVNPPKKCWIGRLFQKKHTVLKVNIREKSPYAVTEEQEYIKILK